MSKKLSVNTFGLSGLSNPIQAAVFAANDLSAAIQSIQEDAPHNDRQWVFYGLPDNVNYVFKIQQLVSGTYIDITGYTFTFSGGDSNINYIAPMQITVGTTPGFTANTNTVTLDGTNGTVDLRSYDIQFGRNGLDWMQPAIDYSWNQSTGVLTLLQTNDVFASGEYLNLAPILQTPVSGGSQDKGWIWNNTQVITGNYTISTTDFGTELIVEGTTSYLALTLPDINTVPENRMLWIESGIGSHINIGLLTYSSGQNIKWLSPNKTALYLGVCERIAIYKQIQADDSMVWRVFQPEGNFKTVGSIFYSYQTNGDILNTLLLDGGNAGAGISSAIYKRLYEFVLSLPSNQVCSFADWSTGNNNLLFSLADPTSGLFHIPDTRNQFIRNSSSSRQAGSYQTHAILNHQHEATIGLLPTSLFGRGIISRLLGQYKGTQTSVSDLTGVPVGTNGTALTTNLDTETRPINVAMNQFIFI